MRNKPRSISNLRTYGALFARSFKSGTVSRGSGCNVLARDRGFPLNLEQSRLTLFCIRVISSGHRCLSCVLQNAPRCVPDVLQILSPAFVTSQAVAVLKRSVEIFGNVRKVVGEIRNV